MPKVPKTELGREATRPEGAEPFGPPRPPTIAELAKRGRKVRRKKPLGEALEDALRDLFDAYLYTLTHPCEVSPYEVLALINAHREAMGTYSNLLGFPELMRKRKNRHVAPENHPPLSR
jgi:hypothetical protein